MALAHWVPSERAQKTVLSKCNSYGAIRLPSRLIGSRITYGNCYTTSSLLSKTSAGNWDLYVIAMEILVMVLALFLLSPVKE